MTFTNNNFSLITETSKAVEYENKNSKEVVYLLPNLELSIVLNPTIVERNSIFNSEKKYHSSALKKFPTRINNGEKPIHYGYSFKFKTEGELDEFLNNLNNI